MFNLIVTYRDSFTGENKSYISSGLGRELAIYFAKDAMQATKAISASVVNMNNNETIYSLVR